jgi:hypothetical protein
MNCLIISLLLVVSVAAEAQQIKVDFPEKGIRELDLTPPNRPTTPDPIPDQNGTYRFTHRIGVYCETADERVELFQYLNVTNGVVGIVKADIEKMAPGATGGADGQMHFWAILPNHTQRMYIQSPEQGRLVMQHSRDDPNSPGTYTTTMAQFDAMNEGQIFWRNARKIKDETLPASILENNTRPIPVSHYRFQSEEGPVQLTLQDIGPATGAWATMPKQHAATVMGGIGYVYNPFNKRVYLVMGVSNATSGCRLTALRRDPKTVSGAGYKPMGDLLLGQMKNRQAEQQTQQTEVQAEIDAEEDAVVRQLMKQQAEVQARIQKKMTDAVANAGMFNDMAEVNRHGISIDDQYTVADLQLQIARRRAEIELKHLRENDIDRDRQSDLNKTINCTNAQRTLWRNYRTDITNLRKRFGNPEASEAYREQATARSVQFNEQMINACQ